MCMQLSQLAAPSQEYQLECARDELQKLSVFEQEGKRKDEIISALRKEIAEYKKCTQSGDIKYSEIPKCGLPEMHIQNTIIFVPIQYLPQK